LSERQLAVATWVRLRLRLIFRNVDAAIECNLAKDGALKFD
jgi:hypothetical protein